MTLDVLRGLAAALTDDAGADALVDYIAADVGHGQGDRDFVDVYSDVQVRTAVFGGTTCTAEGLVQLSPAARRLKSALQRRNLQSFAANGDMLFRGSVGWHITGSMKTARLILASGFLTADGLAGGYGVYFYKDRQKCENYVPQGGWGPAGAAVLECSIYSRISRPNNAEFHMGYGGDRWANNFVGDIVTVKNPLLIFPRAVFAPQPAAV